MNTQNLTVNLFFNAHGVECPPGAAWEKFKGLDTARLFLVAAESWRRQGWRVRRLATNGGDFVPTPFAPDGECSKSFHWYPAVYWQFIAKAKAVAASDKAAVHWFATIDVINFDWHDWKGQQLDARAFPKDAFGNPHGCFNVQTEHKSLSLIGATWSWLETAEAVLLAYDAGKLASLEREYTSDEAILRAYMSMLNVDRMTFSCNTEKDTFPLLHFARSAVAPGLNEYPLC